eukprot:COSAG05_NODE_245_length_12989_cov_32.994725_9_plen_622_part_00
MTAHAPDRGQGDRVPRIVLTGGPCAGKTTALAQIKERLTALGVHVVTVPENATQVFENSGGYHPDWAVKKRCGHLELQKTLLKFQMDAERHYLAIAKLHAETRGTPAVLLCDRGTLDGKSFVEDTEWDEILSECHLEEGQLLSEYDMVCHLVTAAKGAAEHYEFGPSSRNPSRFHNPEQAIDADDKGLAAWKPHADLKIIDNRSGFAAKVQNVMRLICSKLSLPCPEAVASLRLHLRPFANDVFRRAGVDHIITADVVTYGPTSSDVWDWKLCSTKTAGNIVYTLYEGLATQAQTRRSIDARDFESRLKAIGRHKKSIKRMRTFVWQDVMCELCEYPQSQAVAMADTWALDIYGGGAAAGDEQGLCPSFLRQYVKGAATASASASTRKHHMPSATSSSRRKSSPDNQTIEEEEEQVSTLVSDGPSPPKRARRGGAPSKLERSLTQQACCSHSKLAPESGSQALSPGQQDTDSMVGSVQLSCTQEAAEDQDEVGLDPEPPEEAVSPSLSDDYEPRDSYARALLTASDQFEATATSSQSPGASDNHPNPEGPVPSFTDDDENGRRFSGTPDTPKISFTQEAAASQSPTLSASSLSESEDDKAELHVQSKRAAGSLPRRLTMTT